MAHLAACMRRGRGFLSSDLDRLTRRADSGVCVGTERDVDGRLDYGGAGHWVACSGVCTEGVAHEVTRGALCDMGVCDRRIEQLTV